MSDVLQLIELFQQISKRLLHVMLPIVKSGQLSIAEMSVLMRLKKHGVFRVTDLAAMIGIPASTFTGILDRLEGQGLISRKPDPDDRRSVIVSSTPKTEGFTLNIMAPLEQTLKTAFSKMPESRVHRLVGDLKFVLDHLEQKECPGCKEVTNHENR